MDYPFHIRGRGGQTIKKYIYYLLADTDGFLKKQNYYFRMGGSGYSVGSWDPPSLFVVMGCQQVYNDPPPKQKWLTSHLRPVS